MAGKPRDRSGPVRSLELSLAPAERAALKRVASAHGLSLSRLVGTWAFEAERAYRRWLSRREREQAGETQRRVGGV